jgi:hypothetical protein
LSSTGSVWLTPKRTDSDYDQCFDPRLIIAQIFAGKQAFAYSPNADCSAREMARQGQSEERIKDEG